MQQDSKSNLEEMKTNFMLDTVTGEITLSNSANMMDWKLSVKPIIAINERTVLAESKEWDSQRDLPLMILSFFAAYTGFILCLLFGYYKLNQFDKK